MNEPNTAPPNADILIVDDRPENLLALESVLVNLPVNVVRASSGAEALKHLLHRDFAVVILDVRMYGMDGFETASLIRQRDRSKSTPIIFLTAYHKSEEQLARGYSLGAVDYLFKPIVPEVLRSKVSVFVELHRQTEEIKHQAAELRLVERRELERAMAETKLRLEADFLRREKASAEERLRFFTLSIDLLCIAGFDGGVKQANPAFERTLGYAPEEVLDRHFLELVHPEDRAVAGAELERLAGGGSSVAFECRCFVKAAAQRWIAWRAMPYVEEGLFYAVGCDITERKRVEEMKSEFISNVSHELRTPLTSVSGSLRLISAEVAGEIPPVAKELIDVASRNCDRLNLLIDDILDMEKIESGRMEFHPSPELLLPLVEQALSTNRAYADRFGVRFVLDATLPDARVSVDSGRFLQVLTNLLSNAAKFSPSEAAVVVSLSRHEGWVRVSVTDRGPGIAEENQSCIFEKFVQVDYSDGRRNSGTGLGLSIAKALIEKLGGRIGLRSRLDEGSTFYVDLPEVR
jgi:PAS domain S-box-containing protein